MQKPAAEQKLYTFPQGIPVGFDLAITNQTLSEMMGEVLIGNLQEIRSNLP